ncbi:hypothetical protein EJ08DRAFT_74714 [Tothia fuscella]|uniref:Uncharacterized protein n=1 Tax=Tothia fuscella TaxID=1048955 RepID=A0A9P4NX44_9PEZI|nr:hypothetical protein EJ08DRAFT_74714 [Tothia fuscella]
MAEVFDSAQANFLDQSGQSRSSCPSAFGYFGRNGDRSRNPTSSFVTSMDLSPGAAPMEFAFSDSSFSEPDMEWMNLFVDGDTTSPLSNSMSNQDYTPWGNNNNTQTTQGYSNPAVQRVDYTFTQYPQTSRTSNQSIPAQYASGNFGHSDWDFQEHQNPPEISFNTVRDEDPPSASSVLTHASMEPWSPMAGQRFAGLPGVTHDIAIGPAVDESYMNSYPASISMSLESSSPQPQGPNTPSSTRSPSFATMNLHSTSPHTNLGALSSSRFNTDHDQTPRAPQNVFLRATHQTARPVAMKAPQPVPKRKRNEQARREPTHSPFSSGSEYVIVEASPKTAANAKRMNTKLSKDQQPAVFFHESHPPAEEKRSRRTADYAIRKTSNGRKSGGRPLGSHLPSDKANKAKDLRIDGACWICCLQRDSCTAGVVCDRCVKRTQRAQMEHGLGCDRTKLTELKSIFIPDILNKLHEPQTLKAFVGEHISRWSGSAIKLKFTCIFKLPPIECEVYEFEPRTSELLSKIEYFPSTTNGPRKFVETHSPPLGMVQLENVDRSRYDKYISMIVDKHLDKFADRVFKFEKDDFQGRMFRLMVSLQPDKRDEIALLRDIYRLQVVTYMMGRAPAIPRSQHKALYNLHYANLHRDIVYSANCSSKMVNRQLKFLFSALFNQIMESVLKRLQQILRSSSGGAKWTSAFCAILGLAMCFETIQKTVHGNQDIQAKKGLMTEWEAAQRAEESCRMIDQKFGFITNLFRWKYHRGFNPLRDWEDGKVQSTLGDSGTDFVRAVAGLVNEKYDFLYEKQHIAILKDNQDNYTSRLVARFLLSFWGPTTS